MATKWISPTWRMPTDTQSPAGSGNNQSKFDNYSLDFDGTNGYINCGNSSEIDITGPISVSVWFKTSVSDSSSRGIVSKTNSHTSYTQGQYFFDLLSGELRWVAGKTISTPIPINTNEWYHAVGTYDGSNIEVYVNGSLNHTKTALSTSFPSSQPLYIGQRVGQNKFKGEISQVAIFDYALSETQAKYLYNDNDPVNTTVANPQNPMGIPGNSPIAYYDLGGSSTGEAGDNSANPTVNTLTVPNSSVPSATVFDITGSAQLMDLGGSDLWSEILVGDNRTGISTFSSWVKGPFTGYHRIWEMGVSGQDLLRVGTNQKLYYRFGSGSIYRQWTMPSGVDLDSSSWLHIVLVFKAGSVTDASGTAAGNGVADIDLFINGDLCSQDFLSAGASATTWGASNYGIRNYSGQQLTARSNVQIWNSELTAPQITTLYNNGKPYLGTQPQPSNLKGWWRMNADTSNWNGSNWEIGSSTANYSTALDFDQSIPARITLSPDIDLGINSTISMWYKWDGSPALDDYLLGFGFSYLLYLQTGTIRARIGSNFPAFSYTTLANVWYNLIMVRTGDSIEIFINGDSIGTQTGFGTTDNTVFDSIGARASGAKPFNGLISNVAVWNSNQSSEKDNIYNNGTPATSYTNTPTAWWKLDNTTITDSSGNGNTGTNNGATQVSSLVSTLNGASSGMTTANLVNSDLERSIPYSSYSMEFDGIGDFIQLNSAQSFANEFSLSIWIKPNGFSNNQVILGNGSGSDNWIRLSSANQITFKIATGSNLNFSDTGNNLVDGVWQHLLFYRDSSNNVGIYRNGVAFSTTQTNTDVLQLKTIGKRGSIEYTGNISNVAFWSSSLNEDQILRIYNGGVPNSISSLSPVGWWSLAGDSYYNGTDWICPDLSGNSNNGTSGGMGGDELVGVGPGSEANGEATGMNMPENLQGNAPNSTANAFSVNMNFADKTNDVPVVP